MKSPACPRFTTHIRALMRMYTHLDDDDILRMLSEHSCPACTGWSVTPYQPRDPNQTIKESQ